mmetsp:Transcript_7179/g.9561  ORF Transcript_7179/g.9561 Transcript_7179/m.9561 type:complete len:87 (+) Transcript_7179:197-457(+)
MFHSFGMFYLFNTSLSHYLHIYIGFYAEDPPPLIFSFKRAHSILITFKAFSTEIRFKASFFQSFTVNAVCPFNFSNSSTASSRLPN